MSEESTRRIRHTRADARPYRFHGVLFPEGEREVTVTAERAERAVVHSDVEYVEDYSDSSVDLEDLEYHELQERAKAAGVPANQSREELIEALED